MPQKISGYAVLGCSPPLAIQDTGSSFNVYRACIGDTAGEATQITTFSDGATVVDGVHNPRLSPNGSKILFQVLNTVGGQNEIWVVNSTPGSTATQLVTDATRSVFHPFWHPDSNQFIYVRSTTGGGGSIDTGQIELDTVSSPGSPTVLKAAAAGFSPFRPQYNFDGSKIAYVYMKIAGTPDDLRCMNADGSGDASVDNTVGNYDVNNPQTFGWARTQNKLAYTGPTGSDPFVINSDGTGKTQLNTAGPGTGALMRISADCWPDDDSYILTSANLGNGYIDLIRCETDGSNTTRLNTSHGAFSQDYMRIGIIFDDRIWFIESASSVLGGKVASFLLDGTDYRVDLDITLGASLDDFSSGDGWVFS